MAFAAPFLPFLAAAGTAVSAVTGFQSAQYQASVAEQNSKLLEQQAQRETLAANQEMQDQDTQARGEIANLMAQMDASGIQSSGGTMLMRRASAETLAARDRERLGLKRDIGLENTKRQAAGQRAEAKAYKKSGKLGLLTSMLAIPTSYMSSASSLNDYNRGRLSLNANSAGGAH